jgi:signal transduction histidine kinase
VFNIIIIDENADEDSRYRNLLSEDTFHPTVKRNFNEAETLLKANVFDICLYVVGESTKNALDEIVSIKEANPVGSLAVAVKECPTVWEETALIKGADFIFRDPLVPSHFQSVLSKLARFNEPIPSIVSSLDSKDNLLTEQNIPTSALEVLRDFSRILGYSLDYKLFTQHFVLKLREIIKVNKIAVFLQSPPYVTVNSPSDAHRMPCISSVGVPSDVQDCFELTKKAGLGKYFSNSMQIVKRGQLSQTDLDPKIQREFEILDCHTAIPINDREKTLGVAIVGNRVTGSSLGDEELQLLYLLMEELGLAIKNCWLHHQLSANNRLFSDVLSCMSNGNMVVSSNLTIVHSNRAMVQFVKGENPSINTLEFADLPSKLATPIYDVVEKGSSLEPFFFSGGENDDSIYRVSIIPFRNESEKLPQSAMVVMEDFTQIEAAKSFDIESSKAKLIALIAKRFAHEIRNSLVPLTTHQQLLDQEYANEDFRKSLKNALEKETGRIQRFTEQMLYLAQPEITTSDEANVRELLDEAFQATSTQFPQSSKLDIQTELEQLVIRCHKNSLRYAFQEIFTNALQANLDEPEVEVSIRNGQDDALIIEFSDNGIGFTSETAERATEPFFTTRNTGVGLGLTVAQRIIEAHQGTIEIGPRSRERHCDVSILLPQINH